MTDTQKLLAASTRGQHSYVDNVGHGLKTPLNSINALSSLLLLNDQGNLTEDQLEQLKVIHRSGEELTCLVDELLSLFRLRDAGLPLDVDELSLHTLVSEMQGYFDLHIANKPIKFDLVIDPLLPVVETDNQKLLKVLRNLLDNAIRFTEAGSIQIELIGGDDQDFPVICRISDTGCGIPRDKFDLIFGDFRQINESTKRHHDAFGSYPPTKEVNF